MERMFCFAICIMATLAGCASGYRPAGLGGGYSDSPLGNGMYRVSYTGNAYTDPGYAADMAMLRAAEVALAGGYRYFSIVQSGNDSRVGSYTAPSTVNVTNLPAIGSGYQTISVTGGQTTVFSKPSSNMIIKGHKEKREHTFSARRVISSTKVNYGL